MASPESGAPKAHVIVGGFPSTSHAGHDMDHARLKLLEALYTVGVEATVGVNYGGLEAQLPDASLLITYTPGPLPDEEQSAELQAWLERGGRWVALHGSCGGKAAKPRAGASHAVTVCSLFQTSSGFIEQVDTLSMTIT